MLEDNPCRRHPFEVFGIDKSETNRRNITSQVESAKDLLKHEQGAVKGPDGESFVVGEARINELEAILNDPLRRLQAEQFVHQAHPFSGDVELAAALEAEFSSVSAPLQTLDSGAVIASALGPLLPEIEHADLPDDLPDPARPEPFPVEVERWDQTILRDF
jgi:hypothetical protein